MNNSFFNSPVDTSTIKGISPITEITSKTTGLHMCFVVHTSDGMIVIDSNTINSDKQKQNFIADYNEAHAFITQLVSSRAH